MPLCALPTRGSKLITLPTCTSIRYPHPRLPTSPSDVRKTSFYAKLEHNTDQTTRIHSLFLTSSRNAKNPFCIWYWHTVASVNLDEQWVVRGTKILVRNQSLFGFLLWVCGCFIVFWVINQWSMLHVMEWEYWLCLLIFIKNVTTCSLDLCLFIGILSVMVNVSHSGPKFLLGLNFSVCMCYLVKQNQKKSRKCGPSMCVASQKQNRNMQLFTLLLFTIL